MAADNSEFIRVPLERVEDNPFQVRLAYDSPSDLADAIRQMAALRPETSGLIQVPLARIVRNGQVLDPQDYGGTLYCLAQEEDARVQLAAGHRRLRVFRALSEADDQFATLPVTVAVLDDETMADVAWHENEDREDLSPVERALAIRRAIEAFGWTQAQVGKRRGMTQASVSNVLRLLDLPAGVQDLLNRRVITERHARALVSLVGFGVATGKMLRMLGQNKPPESAADVRSIAEVEQAVKDEIDRKTQIIRDWPLDFASEDLPACEGCDRLVRISRQKRCRDPKCFEQKTTYYRHLVTGPQKAAELHARYPNWRKFEVQPFSRCDACERRGNDFPAGTQWYKASIFAICPGCWQLADLPEPEPVLDAPATQEEARPEPVTQKLDMHPAADEAKTEAEPRRCRVCGCTETSPCPGGCSWVEADLCSRCEDKAGGEPAETLHTASLGNAQATMAIQPAVILTARVLPGPVVAERRVMLSIAEEGKPPAVLKADVYAGLPALITEALDAFFGENGNASGNISMEIPAEVSDAQSV